MATCSSPPRCLQADRAFASCAFPPEAGRLYALCADADSLLMLDAVSGAPMMVNRVGVNPSAMALDETGTLLAVAAENAGKPCCCAPAR